jgi:hypothetical protein
MSEELSIKASSAGELELSIRSDLVSVRTHFRDLCLEPPSSAGAEADVIAAATVSTKKLTNALGFAVLNPRRVIGCASPFHFNVIEHQ